MFIGKQYKKMFLKKQKKKKKIIISNNIELLNNVTLHSIEECNAQNFFLYVYVTTIQHENAGSIR